MKERCLLFSVCFVFVMLCLVNSLAMAQDGFTQKDRELLIRLEVKLEEIDKRFEQVDKRFEQVDKRFEQVDKRLEEFRQDINNRFGQMMDFFYILAGIFATMVAAVIGFAYWDRRTILYKEREHVMEITARDSKTIQETSIRLEHLIEAMRRLAEKSPDVREVLQQLRLL